MDKITARRRKAARDAAARPDGAAAAGAPMPTDDALLAGDTPTGLLSQLAEHEDDLDPYEQEAREEAKRQAESDRQARLDTFGASLAGKRQAAIDARQQSGIEDEWTRDEEFYEGIDDGNRHEQVTLKPRNQTGGSSIIESQSETDGSTLFVGITRTYVDFSAGRAADMLLPTDEPNWDLKESPMPDVIEMMESTKPIELPPGQALPDGAPATYGDAAQAMVSQARKQVAKAKKRVEDWLDEGQYYAEQRKVLRDAAKVGVGILKGPFPAKRVSRAVVRSAAPGQRPKLTMKVQNKTSPISKRISYRNFYPDPACGENIHNGSFVWERDDITARKLRDLLGTKDADGAPMYIEDAINACLKEGPQRKHDGDANYNAPDATNYEIWYFHGVAAADDLRAAGLDPEDGEALPVVVTMVNDRVIKVALSTLDTGEFPYDVMVWQEREGHWAGISVACQVRTPQRIVNAAVRNLMDNAGLAAGPQFVIMKDLIKPMGKNTKYGIRPRQIWEMKPDANVDDVKKAFTAVELPMLAEPLLGILQMGLKMAEDVTGMPMMMQGQQGQASDTVGGMQILTNNSNSPMRTIAKQFDDRITVPHLLRYYEWLLLYGPAEDEKGEFTVVARGSSALFEKDAQAQAIMQMGALIQNPAFRINPEKWIKQAMKAQRLDPEQFQYSDVEWKQLQAQMAQQPQPQDPRIQTATIAAQARVQVANITAGVQQKRIEADTDRDSVFAQAEAQRTQADAEARQRETDQKLQLAYLDYANRHQLSLDQVKAKLADTAMKLQAQKELSAMTLGTELHKHHNPSPQALPPPTEPAGRAANGQAWQA